MTQAKPRFKSFEEYASLDAEAWVRLRLPEGRAEYVDGELIELPPESRLNLLIARYLSRCLEQIGVPFELIYTHAFEVEVPLIPQAKEKNRYPDLVVLRPEHLDLTRERATITREMPPPQLIAEVVSPGTNNQTRDYTTKREQYRLIQLPEYWLIDPDQAVVMVLLLENGRYVGKTYKGHDRIDSATFGLLQLTVEQILSAGG